MHVWGRRARVLVCFVVFNFLLTNSARTETKKVLNYFLISPRLSFTKITQPWKFWPFSHNRVFFFVLKKKFPPYVSTPPFSSFSLTCLVTLIWSKFLVNCLHGDTGNEIRSWRGRERVTAMNTSFSSQFLLSPTLFFFSISFSKFVYLK